MTWDTVGARVEGQIERLEVTLAELSVAGSTIEVIQCEQALATAVLAYVQWEALDWTKSS